MADLTQTILVNLTGGGNLPSLLSNAAAGAAALNKGLNSAGTVSKPTAVNSVTPIGGVKYPPGSGPPVPGQGQGNGVGGPSVFHIATATINIQTATITHAGASVPGGKDDDGKADKRADEMNRHLKLAAAGAFGGGMGAITGLAGLFNPWAVQQFQRATADLGATIGRDLLPYLQTATRFVRDIADAYASLPAPIRSLVAGSIALGTAVAGAAVVVWGISRGLSFLATTAMAAAAAIGLQTKATQQQAIASMAAGATGGAGATATAAAAAGGKGLLAKAGVIGLVGLLGYELFSAFRNKDNPQGDGSSFGMAARPASVSSIEGYMAEIQTDVLFSTQKIADNSDKQVDMLDGILKGLQGKTPDGRTKNWDEHTEDEKTARIEWAIVTLGLSELWRSL